MTHEEKNIGGGAEHPGSDEQKISILLSGLQRVEAPKDFDFHLKARIANAKPEEYRKSGLLPILKYAMPLALLLVVGAGIMVNSSYVNWQTPTVAGGPAPSRTDVPQQALQPESGTDGQAASTPETKVPVVDPNLEPGMELAAQPPAGGSNDFGLPKTATPRAPAGFSADKGLKPAPTPVIPPEFRTGNINTSSNRSIVPIGMAAKPLSVRSALESIGVEADIDENKWKVKSVKDSTIAAQMGLKAGDKIESIDGKAIDDKTVYKDGSFKVKTIRVRRGEAAVDLELPKPKK